MKSFMNDKFLLNTPTAERLYEAVSDLPVIDWHCHLDPREIAEDKTFTNMTELWLPGDHYKWRVMRACGVDEDYITGEADDYAKFEKWACVIERCIGNPLYHWTHLELQRVFDCDIPLSAKTAKEIWQHCRQVLSGGLRVSDIIKMFNVELIATSDNPISPLDYHKMLRRNAAVKAIVKPTFRPSEFLAIENSDWADYIEHMGYITGVDITDYESLKEAAYYRIDYFDLNGCCMSDHALDPPVYIGADGKKLDEIVKTALAYKDLTYEEACMFKTEMLVDLGREYARRSWTMQLHMGAARSVNTNMTTLLGADKGYDCMSCAQYGDSLLRFLNRLEVADSLPRTILFCLNPRDNDMLVTVAGCFPGVQTGPAWWFNDHKQGMEQQMTALANNGVLAVFPGMLTDSRSFLSYTRHEYFRRILCNLFGEWAENGEYPADMGKLEEMVRDISYFNARGLFI